MDDFLYVRGKLVARIVSNLNLVKKYAWMDVLVRISYTWKLTNYENWNGSVGLDEEYDKLMVG